MHTPPDAIDWSAVKALFDAALAQPAAEREAFVQGSGASAEVQAEVLSLLAHSTEAFLAEPAAALVDAPQDGAAGHAGDRLGAWRLVRPLGSGGMGEVWLAERADGAYTGEAAVKLLKRGMDSAAVLQRFAQERQALARLDHPHIARLFDAGLSPQGLPYFVMEHVQGRPIDQAAAALPLEGKLRLFLQLTDAVAHAHRHLLVHRDLKPSNVLVNGEGQVKLLDFGIAKALDPLHSLDDPGAPEPTLAGQRPFTPTHASPEQVRGEPVSTATDVYSLGVLLYQLLTGQRPYGRTARSPVEAAQAVLNEAPTRPSSLTPPEGPAANAQAWLATRQRLQGDLDNILLKALEKDVPRRYAGVDAFAADLRATLAGYPVSARAPSRGYLLAKFVQRNRLAVGLAALAALALVTGTSVALWQSRVADRERALAEQRFKDVRQLAGQLVFKYHDQLEYLEGATQVRESLLVDAAAFLDSLRSAATDDPTLAHELATTYYRIAMLQGVSQTVNTGQFAQAEANLDKATELHGLFVARPETSAEVVADAVDMQVSKAEMLQRRGRLAQAVGVMQQALRTADARLARDPHDPNLLTTAIGAHGVLARMLGTTVAHANLGRLEEARVHVDQAVALARRLLAPSPANVESLNTLAFALGEQANWLAQSGQPEEGARVFAEQLALRDRNAASRPEDAQFRNQRVIARSNLAGALAQSGRHAEARQWMREAQALAQSIAQADPENAAAQGRLKTLKVLEARLLVLGGDTAAARRLLSNAMPVVPDGASFSEQRWRAEALVWAARAWRGVDATRALAQADEAIRLMAGEDDNASRAWMRALALGERALALAASPSASAAAPEAARDTLAAWKAAPQGGRIPGSYVGFVAPIRELADRP